MKKFTQYLKIVKWHLKGKPAPPPHLIKQQMLLANARIHDVRIMVETGTLHGDMVEAMKNNFKEIYSIEISPALAQKARSRFVNDKNVHIIENDSAIALKTLVHEIHEPALFWLDGHYSGGDTGKGETNTPIMDELASIYTTDFNHIVMIDDARCFGEDKDYPDPDKLRDYIKGLRPGVEIRVKNDCIHVSTRNK